MYPKELKTVFFMDKKPIEIKITSEFITLGQFLKFADIIESGGEAKEWLGNNEVLVNSEFDNRRGRKLRPGDLIEIDKKVYEIR